MAKGEEELNLCLSVMSTPFTVGIRVSDRIGSRGSAVDHVLESSVFEDQGNHLAPVHQQKKTCLQLPYRICTLQLPCSCLTEWFTRPCKAYKTKLLL